MDVKVLIEGALESELDKLMEEFSPLTKVSLGIRNAYVSKSGVAIVNTAVGVSNAAATTALACSILRPQCIISQGTAGAHDQDLHTGDIVIGETILRLGTWMTPKRKSGVDPFQWDMLTLPPNQVYPDCICHSDKALVALALQEARHLGYTEQHEPKVRVGCIGSAEVYDRENAMIEHLHKRFGTNCEEMESFAAAHIAEEFNVPFLGLRVISNNELLDEEFYEPIGEKIQALSAAVARSLTC